MNEGSPNKSENLIKENSIAQRCSPWQLWIYPQHFLFSFDFVRRAVILGASLKYLVTLSSIDRIYLYTVADRSEDSMRKNKHRLEIMLV